MAVALVVTIVAVLFTVRSVAPAYEMQASIVLVPPKSTDDPQANRFLTLGGLEQAAAVFTRAMASDQTHKAATRVAPDGEFTVEPDYTTSAPIVVSTATASDEQAARRLLDGPPATGSPDTGPVAGEPGHQEKLPVVVNQLHLRHPTDDPQQGASTQQHDSRRRVAGAHDLRHRCSRRVAGATTAAGGGHCCAGDGDRGAALADPGADPRHATPVRRTRRARQSQAPAARSNGAHWSGPRRRPDLTHTGAVSRSGARRRETGSCRSARSRRVRRGRRAGPSCRRTRRRPRNLRGRAAGSRPGRGSAGRRGRSPVPRSGPWPW